MLIYQPYQPKTHQHAYPSEFKTKKNKYFKGFGLASIIPEMIGI